MGIITLFHGTIYDFDNIDLARGKPFKDFGQGFYTTETMSQAVGMANRNCQIETELLKTRNKAYNNIGRWLYTYEFPETALFELSVKRFEKADKEWARFVTENRTQMHAHDYDIVIGATANDKTNPTIVTYLNGAYGEIGSDAALDILIQLLEPHKLPQQFFFGTQKAVDCLKLIKKERLK